MQNIKIFTKEELEDNDTYKLFSKKVDDGLTFGYGGTEGDEIYKLATLRIQLNQSLKKLKGILSTEVYEKYYILLVKLKFFTLEDLSENEIVDLFKKNTVLAFKNELIFSNLESKIRQVIFSEPNIQKRDFLLKDIRNALKENIENLGSERIKLRSSDKLKESSLKNWLADYDYFLGAGKHREIDISNYMFKGKNVRLLKNEEKMILKKILFFYEKLKLDMTHPNGIATYPLSMFGIKEIGSDLDKKYLPTDPEEYKKEIEERKKAREEKRKIVKGEKGMDNYLLRREKDVLNKTKDNLQTVPARKKSDYDIKKEEKFSKLKPIPKISIAKLSTVQSLQKLNIDDFRSYGSDTKSCGAYMLTKIKKLAENSPESKEAIKYYLRKSELYNVYLSQGKESLDSKKDIAEIAHNRKNKGEKYLGKEEFEVLKSVLKAI